MANKRITQLPTAPQVEDNDYLAIDNTSTPTAENEGGTRKILVKDITAKSADAVEYDNTTSGLEADNVQDAIDEVLEEGGKVQDVYENGESVVDPTDKIARIHGHKEVTQAQYDALPSSKLTDGIMYCIKDANFSAEDVPYDNSDSGLESEDVQSAVDEIADVLGALKVEGTVENAQIATFNDGAPLPMPKLEIAVEPQQDLHGYDAPWVGGAGKNKFNIDDASAGGFDKSGETFTNNATDTRATAQIIVQLYNGTTYVKSSEPATGEYPSRRYCNISIDSAVTQLRIKHNGLTRDLVIYLPWTRQGDYTISFLIPQNNPTTVGGLVIKDIMICENNYYTPYLPYSNICPISGHTEGNIVVSPTTDAEDGQTYTIQFKDGSNPLTVYGGSLDVVSGVLTLTYLGVDMGTLTWAKQGDGFFFSNNVEGLKIAGDAISSLFKIEHYYPTMLSTNGTLWINDTRSQIMAHLDGYTVTADFKTAMNGVQLVYELATPTIIPLGSVAISSLLGVNNIFANTGKINKAVYIRDLNIVINNLLNA